MERGKKYQEAVKLLDREGPYPLKEAIELVKRASYANFDETVEIHLRTGLDPRNAKQQVRGVAVLPHGLGKQIRVLVFAQGDAEEKAREASADFVGNEDLIKKIESGWLDFDVAIATPDMMGKIGKLGKILGRRGLMPNPKSGTVVQADDLPRAISEVKKGQVEFRLDKLGVIHVPVGKVSFDTEKLTDNVATLVEAVLKAKPTGVKGQYLKSAYICSTMGPGIPLDIRALATISAT
jgi:large subunit ribosomal protein L1